MLKEPEWFRAVIMSRSSRNWTFFERIDGTENRGNAFLKHLCLRDDKGDLQVSVTICQLESAIDKKRIYSFKKIIGNDLAYKLNFYDCRDNFNTAFYHIL